MPRAAPHFMRLIDAHASLVERVQAARDSLFARRRSRCS